ncbi:hypothetical protein [Mucilaginibacter ginsenosidivorax]|uniref:Lipoprotein n=1 Tax=Mucilaginibacter ginsenosidivorax TaxID=862126 RepID=A0A5B8W0E3_9SPHI|nr:hypothetical protein [Mucilaginibacter ginsenosidivorax]QEC77143.1 hypothetical protein FSB76_14750 [Mucilaginibacter ginsenosidivorax]
MKSIFYIITISTLLSGCSDSTHKAVKTKSVPVDTTNSFKIGNLWVTPKKEFKFNSLREAGSDTIHLVVCADYVYWPFGKIKDQLKFSSSLLNNFKVVNKTYKMPGGPAVFQVLKHASSKLIFFFDNSDGETHTDIFKGEIYDADVSFSNNIKIGIDFEGFYRVFFDYFPGELKNHYKVIQFSSCVDGITHTYTFKNGKLNSVVFTTYGYRDSFSKVDY